MPVGPVFDRDANALRDVTEALSRAKSENRRVLIHWGANDCDTCLRLHALMMHDSALKRILSFEYDLVLVDVGSRDRNLDLALNYGVAPQASGIPWLTMLDNKGQPIANLHAGTFGDGRGSFDAAKLAEFLRNYQARYPAADAVLNAALAQARQSKVPLLVQFTSPTIERCRVIEQRLSRMDVASILDRNVLRVRIDVDRTIGGREVLRRYSGVWQTAVPWFVMLDSSTAARLGTSSDGGSDIAALESVDAIERFCDLIKRHAKLLTPQEIEWLKKSLSEMNPPRENASSAERKAGAESAKRASTGDRPAHAAATGD